MTPSERKLNRDLRKLVETGPLEAPARVEHRLIAAFRRQRRRRAVLRWSAVGGAVAALAAGLAVMTVLRPTFPVPTAAGVSPLAAMAQETADFVALPDADMGAPLGYATVVRVQLPRYALRDIGFAVNEQSATDRVQADVLLGQDGLARAVRFIQ